MALEHNRYQIIDQSHGDAALQKFDLKVLDNAWLPANDDTMKYLTVNEDRLRQTDLLLLDF